MKHLKIITLFLFSTNILFSQTDSPVKTHKRISYGVSISPTLNYRTLISNGPNDVIKEIRNENEITGFGFRAGLTFDYKLTKKLNLQTGLIFAQRNFRTTSRKLNWSNSSISNITEAYISRRYDNIDIPVKLQYKVFETEKWNWFISTGAIASFFINHTQRNHIKVSNKWETTKDELLDVALTIFYGEIESGIAFRINPTIQFRGSLYFQHAITATNPKYKTKDFIYTGGVNLGLIFTPFK